MNFPPYADEFLDAYDCWQQDCLNEYNAEYGKASPRKYYCMPEGDYEPHELVEFSEDGDAYPHGRCGINWIRGAVTPWAESEHYVQ